MHQFYTELTKNPNLFKNIFNSTLGFFVSPVIEPLNEAPQKRLQRSSKIKETGYARGLVMRFAE
ncbi:TPA: hypothetical protein ACW59Z_001194 [Legionella pneumophila]|nr:hypothetical protein [Legionella pneumophila]